MCHFKRTIVVAAIAVAWATSTAFAQDSFRGQRAEMRGDFGDSSRANEQSSDGRYRSSAPMVVQYESARSSVAQVPQSRWSYSCEPCAGSSNVGGCCPWTIPAYATAKAQRGGYHSNSYEAPMRSYRSWSRRS